MVTLLRMASHGHGATHRRRKPQGWWGVGYDLRNPEALHTCGALQCNLVKAHHQTPRWGPFKAGQDTGDKEREMVLLSMLGA